MLNASPFLSLPVTYRLALKAILKLASSPFNRQFVSVGPFRHYPHAVTFLIMTSSDDDGDRGNDGVSFHLLYV